jgi:hypothetical protein
VRRAFAAIDQAFYQRGGGDPNIHYLHGYWMLGREQALVIETPVPECEIWNFQLDNYWMESLDYRYLPIHVNSHTARYEPDGSLKLVIAAEDPGVGNHLTTAGHTSGTMLFALDACKVAPDPEMPGRASGVPACRALNDGPRKTIHHDRRRCRRRLALPPGRLGRLARCAVFHGRPRRASDLDRHGEPPRGSGLCRPAA